MLLKGRETIFTDVDEITKTNILEVLNKAFPIHLRNVMEEVYLFNYVSGVQPSWIGRNLFVKKSMSGW